MEFFFSDLSALFFDKLGNLMAEYAFAGGISYTNYDKNGYSRLPLQFFPIAEFSIACQY